jgi:hypothetical protein
MIFILFRFYLCFKRTGRVGTGGDDINGRLASFGLLVRLFFVFLLLLYSNS